MKEPQFKTKLLPDKRLKELPPGTYSVSVEEIHQAFNEKGEPEIRIYGKLVEEKK